MVKMLSKYIYWPGMHKDVEEFIEGCLACARAKPGKPHNQGKRTVVIPERPLAVVGMDIYGPLPETEEGYKYILTITDHFSRFIRLIPLRDVNRFSVAKAFFTGWIVDFGFPELLAFDGGSQFRSALFMELGRL